MIFGSLIGIFGLIGFAVEIGDYQERASWNSYGLLLATILVTVGGCLFYFGRSNRIRKRKAFDLAFSMYREDKRIDVFRIRSEMNISEIEIRKMINKAQTDGLFPEDVEIT